MSRVRYEIGESPDPGEKPRRVFLRCPVASPGSVEIYVNGVVVAGFYPGCDHLELFNPRTDITGLAEVDGLLQAK